MSREVFVHTCSIKKREQKREENVYHAKRPVRKKNGQFAKGHKPLIRPKYVYSQNFPKLYCNTCWVGNMCPDYHEGYVCAHRREFKKFKTRNIEEVIEELCANAKADIVRLQYRWVVETL